MNACNTSPKQSSTSLPQQEALHMFHVQMHCEQAFKQRFNLQGDHSHIPGAHA